MNLEELNLVELNAQEVQETEGGWPRLTGFLDGIDGNLEWHWWQNLPNKLIKRERVKLRSLFFII